MQLKRFQERVVQAARTFLSALAAERASGNRHASMDAWERCVPALRLGSYARRRNGLGQDLPTFCIKVPTGGGKTLLATQILGAIHATILRSRNGAGLVLWVVPSDQIYKDTLKALRDRRHFYRESLEHAVSRRIEVWEKEEIKRLTPVQLASNLNILVLVLASTNRETKDQLRFFRDSGGNIVQHFPPEDEADAHRKLKEKIPNLDMLVDDEARGEHLAATSIANLVRLCEPAVILDEGHKATSDLARKTIEGFNASVVVELSATPPADANVLVRVTGRELLDEEMIKLPVNVMVTERRAWKDMLTLARDKRSELAESAAKHYRKTDRAIRPIVLVQVERTGEDQRDAGFVHSEDVREHLVQRLGIPAAAVAVKSSAKDDIEGMDLLDPDCPVEWIITKSALQEGWDCPFAYILVSLVNASSPLAMTQLVGRVLRQPDVRKTEFQDLNESYVFCLHRRAAEVTRDVKAALEKEGYEGEAAAVIDRSDGGPPVETKRAASFRPEFRKWYGRPFEGRIFLPRFCVETGPQTFEHLDYFRHLFAGVEVARFAYGSIDWDLGSAATASKERLFRVQLGEDPAAGQDVAAVVLESDAQVTAWLVAQLGGSHFGFKQLRVAVSGCIDRVLARNPDLRGRLALAKFELRDRMEEWLRVQTDKATERAFQQLHASGRLKFFLLSAECRFEIPPTVEVRRTRQLQHDDGEPIQRSLFDFVPEEDVNGYEKSVALYLDKHPEVLWWYRNLVGPQWFSIQGPRRQRIYPDFVVQEGREKRPIPRVLVVETKGEHLAGNVDTDYKRRMTDFFNEVGRNVTWQELGDGFAQHTFRFQVLDEGDETTRHWKDELGRLLGEPID